MLENFESYLLKEKRLSIHTVTAYVNDTKSFLEFLEYTNQLDWNEVSYQIVRAWMVELLESDVAPKSVNRKLSSLRVFFGWLKRNGCIEVDPMLKIRGPKVNKRLPEFVKKTEIDSQKTDLVFLNDFNGVRDKLLFELLYQTGMRRAEVIGLKEADFSNGQVKVLGKNQKERILPISSSLMELVNHYRRLKNDLFPDQNYLLVTDKGKKLYDKFVYRKINFYLSKITSLQKKSPHILRHTFATHMLNEGASLEVLKELLGHADLSATQIYTHNSFDEITKIYKHAHPRGDK